MPIHVLGTRPPVVHVGLNVGSAFATRGRGGLPQDMNALVDTGASRTAIAPHRINALGPQHVGKDVFIRPDGTKVWGQTYAVRLSFEPNVGDQFWPLKVRWFSAVVVSVAPATPGVDVLIGQDVLSELVLSWDGPRGRLLLMY